MNISENNIASDINKNIVLKLKQKYITILYGDIITILFAKETCYSIHKLL